MYMSTFLGFGIVDRGKILALIGVNKLQMGQQFRDKKVVLFVIKNYSIRKLVEYKVLKSDHIKYHDKYNHFGNGCNWSICVTYR